MKGIVKHILLPNQLLGKDINFGFQFSSKSLELSVKEKTKTSLFTVDFVFYANIAVNHYAVDRQTRISSMETHVCI